MKRPQPALVVIALALGATPFAGRARSALQPRPLVVIAVGDVLLAGRAEKLILKAGPAAPLAKVSRKLSSDLTIANLECPLATGGKREKKKFTFRASPAAVRALTDGGINAVSLANNHSCDYGKRALLQTMETLSAAGVSYVGAGRNLQSARAPVYLSLGRPRLRVGLLAYSDMLPVNFYATPARPGTNPARVDNIRVARPSRAATAAASGGLAANVSAARARADAVIVCFHWGKERASRPTARQKLLARAAVDAGADLVVGHHPHVLQGIESYRGRFIAYSLGNFLFPSRGRCRESAILVWRRWAQGPGDRGAAASVEIIPVLIEGGLPRLAGEKKGQPILRRLARLSQQLGLKLVIESDHARASLNLTAGAGSW